MKAIGLGIIIIGLGLLGLSQTFERYTNEEEYNEKYMSLSGQENASEKFYELRKEYLTPKIDLENYGITLTITGTIFLILSIIGFRNLRTPRKKVWIVVIGIVAALFTNVFYVGDLFLEMYRESYPHWADSLAIPLMGVPFLIIVSLTWTGLNSIGISGDFKLGVPLLLIKLNNLNYWYASILTITILITILTIVTGYFWQVISGFLWTFFYLSILAGRREAKIAKINTNANNVYKK
jgi:uncharacterized membrane protein